MTRAPNAATRRATSRPSPSVEPVTITTLPFMDNSPVLDCAQTAAVKTAANTTPTRTMADPLDFMMLSIRLPACIRFLHCFVAKGWSRGVATRDRMSLRKTVLIRTPKHSPPTNKLCQNPDYGFAPDIRSRVARRDDDGVSVEGRSAP